MSLQNKKKITEHPFFTMSTDTKQTVNKQMKKLRGARYMIKRFVICRRKLKHKV